MAIDLTGQTVEAQSRIIKVGKILAHGDICDLYNCTLDGEDAVLKSVRNKANTDLVMNEARVLRRLYPPSAKDDKFYRYLSKCWLASPNGFNVLAPIVEHVSMDAVLKAFPDGIDFRDMVWMFKRALVGLGFAHRLGIIHGAVLPAHILVHPVTHGAKIVDWTYALSLNAPEITAKPAHPTAWDKILADDEDEFVDEPPDMGPRHIRAFVRGLDDFYAPEVFAKQTPTPATDIYMLAKCAFKLIGGNIESNAISIGAAPYQIRRFLLDCLDKNPSDRPQDAWQLHEDFDKLLRDVVGPPAYRAFNMPVAT